MQGDLALADLRFPVAGMAAVFFQGHLGPCLSRHDLRALKLAIFRHLHDGKRPAGFVILRNYPTDIMSWPRFEFYTRYTTSVGEPDAGDTFAFATIVEVTVGGKR